MSLLDRSALDESSLSDLHAIASELGIDGYRRLRRDELIDALLTTQGGVATDGGRESDAERKPIERRSRSSRSSSSQSTTSRQRRPRSGSSERREEVKVEGKVELRRAGSAQLKVSNSGWDGGDVFISAAQVRRCELKDGDLVSGPARPPRRSERYHSLVRIETVNGKSADDISISKESGSGGRSSRGRQRGGELTYPTVSIGLETGDPTLAEIARLTPIGRGSRVTIAGGPFAGKSETLRRIAGALSPQGELSLTLLLVGIRPEEEPVWKAAGADPKITDVLGSDRAASERAVRKAVEESKRAASKGSHSVVLIDTLDAIGTEAARESLAAARSYSGGGSLTVIGTAALPFGGETTVITLSTALAGARKFPAIDLAHSGTIRPDLIVGERGANAIAKAFSKAVR